MNSRFKELTESVRSQESFNMIRNGGRGGEVVRVERKSRFSDIGVKEESRVLYVNKEELELERLAAEALEQK